MKIIIQKFGGTSVKNQERREMAAQKIINAQKSGYQPVVVVSAIGRKGDPYATDTLIDFVQRVDRNTNPREMDIILSCGEIISAVVMVNTLRNKGYDGVAITGRQAGIITDQHFGQAEVIRVKPDYIIETIKKGKIPVVAGFQGATEDGEITTLGRGGSDTTAAVLGETLGATAIEIYTDVDGIMTADPRIVPNASLLKHICYSEVFQIADQGARVIHPRAIEIAMRSRTPLIIKNTMNDSPGTIISFYNEAEAAIKNRDRLQLITGIAHILGRTQVTIDNVDAETENDLLIKLADNGISIDIINIFPEKMVFTIDGCFAEKAKAILDDSKCKYSMIHDCSKVSVVGNRMRGVPGVMSRIIRSLVKNKIEVLQTSDSHTTISCLVRGKDTIQAVLALHEEFKLYMQ
jgi:aspartate kinase